MHAALIASILSPTELIHRGGLPLATAIIFAETGLLIGFFLPGDSLLFIAGFLAAKPKGLPHLPALPLVVSCLIVAAIVGNQVGYLIGRRVGPALFTRQDSRFFKQANVAKAQEFFGRYGDRTLIIARFVPIVRTFVPVLAGVGRMDAKRFLRFNIIGGVAWAGVITTLGYFLGQIKLIRTHIEFAVLALVAISLVPVGLEVLKHRRAAAR